MDSSQLITAGLNTLQASMYALLFEKGEISPNDAAAELNISRTNGYKVLDKLVEMGLATKRDVAKKIVYSPTNPQALSNLAAEQRNLATAREEAVRQVMTELLSKYHEHTAQPSVTVVTGKDSVANAYRNQVAFGEPIHFIRSRMDIPIMGFDLMHDIRALPSHHGINRLGITPDLESGVSSNPASDVRSNLERTWVRQEDYTSPVEWSICGSNVLIVLFDEQPHAVTIDSPLIADSFRQIWHLLDTCLKQMSYYKDLPRKPA